MISVEPGKPIDEAAKADGHGLPTAYEGFPEDPLTLPKLGRILNQLSEVATTQQDHKRIGIYLVTAMVDKQPKAPITLNEVQRILDRFHEEPENTKKEKKRGAGKDSFVSNRHNKSLCRQAMISIVLGFECPFLSESFLLRSPLEFRKSIRKELSVHDD